MTESEFERDVSLDKYALHEESAKQANLYYKWAKKYAEAKADTLRATEKVKVVRGEGKAKLDRKRGELDTYIRLYWQDEGIFNKKPTEPAIVSWIIQNKDYIELENEVNEEIKEATDEMIQAVEDEGAFEGGKIAMTHKKESIGNEVALWLGGYYSDPKIPKEYRDLIEEKEDEETGSMPRRIDKDEEKKVIKKSIKKKRRVRDERYE